MLRVTEISLPETWRLERRALKLKALLISIFPHCATCRQCGSLHCTSGKSKTPYSVSSEVLSTTSAFRWIWIKIKNGNKGFEGCTIKVRLGRGKWVLWVVTLTPIYLSANWLWSGKKVTWQQLMKPLQKYSTRQRRPSGYLSIKNGRNPLQSLPSDAWSVL